jgi:hypothetical protein
MYLLHATTQESPFPEHRLVLLITFQDRHCLIKTSAASTIPTTASLVPPTRCTDTSNVLVCGQTTSAQYKAKITTRCKTTNIALLDIHA